VKEVEMGGAYSTYAEKKNAYIILLESLKESYSENVRVDGRIILKWIS